MTRDMFDPQRIVTFLELSQPTSKTTLDVATEFHISFSLAYLRLRQLLSKNKVTRSYWIQHGKARAFWSIPDKTTF